MKTIQEKAEMINDYNQYMGFPERYWVIGDRCFVCYDSMSDIEDIHEINSSKIESEYENINEIFKTKNVK